MIELRKATVGAGGFSLKDLSLRVAKGEYAVVMGRTGIGKTTILESICGLRKLREGQVLIQGVDVTRWATPDRNVGYVPQDLALFPTLTVREHLEFGMRLRRYDRKYIEYRVSGISEILGIRQLLQRHVKGLSGGESQRVALGRAIAFGPSVLLLDEPLSALDEKTRLTAQSLLRDINQQTGVSVLHVTHNESEAEALADRKIRIESQAGLAVVSESVR